MLKIYVSTIILLIILSSCNQEGEIKNRYQVISLLYTNLVDSTDNIHSVLPGPPPKTDSSLTKKQLDSIDLAYLKLTQKLISENFKKKKISKKYKIAIYPVLNNKSNLNFELNIEFKEYKNLFDKLNNNNNNNNNSNSKNVDNIDISKIHTNRNDSIFYFNDNLLKKYDKDFHEFDYLINFSNVVFNKNYSRAIIVCSISSSKLASVSSIYFLEKTKNGRWIIEFEKELTIS